MKHIAIIACIVFLAVQATLIDAGSRRKAKKQKPGMPTPEQMLETKRGRAKKQKPGMPTPEHMLEITRVVNQLPEDCKDFVQKYGGKGKATLKASCKKMKTYKNLLDNKGCHKKEWEALWNVLRCNSKTANVEYQKDITSASTVTLNQGTTSKAATRGSQTTVTTPKTTP